MRQIYGDQSNFLVDIITRRTEAVEEWSLRDAVSLCVNNLLVTLENK